MAVKPAKRISSLFSLRSNCSDKSTDAAQSPPLPHDPRLSIEPSSPIASEQVGSETQDSSASNLQAPSLGPSLQTPPPDPLPLQILPEDDDLSRSPQMLSPSIESGFMVVNRTRSKTESMTGSYTGIAGSNDSENQAEHSGEIRPKSRIENKRGWRPASPPRTQQHRSPSESKLSRRSWLPTKSKTEPQSEEGEASLPSTWFIHPQTKIPYDASPLIRFEKVSELWQDHGNTIIYLHSGVTNRGPSFKLSSACFASSKKLSSLVRRKYQMSQERTPSLNRELSVENLTNPLSLLLPPPSILPSTLSRFSPPNSPPGSPPGSPTGSPEIGPSTENDPQTHRKTSDPRVKGGSEIHLYVPLPLQADLTKPEPTLTSDDVETLVAIRNTFAFLAGEPLIATTRHPSIFSIFLRISKFLKRYEFTNIDGSTFGIDALNKFRPYVEDFKLADVRNSREQTIEAITLGESMRFFELYNEGFVHGVGKYDELIKLRSPKFHHLTEITRLRLERAQLDLKTRLQTVRTRLKDFEFPSLFSGIANSTTSTESKLVRFKAWKLSFLAMRRHVMSFYRHRYGAWPPNAKSKKNSFEESGLNRILLRELYQDFSDLYDVLVNRSALTTRSADLDSDTSPIPLDSDDSAPALRRVMGEFDHSSPPVQPPIPFDTPQLPSLTTTRRGYQSLDAKKQKKERVKPLSDDEINQALMQSYNRDSIKGSLFLEAFMSFERKQAHGKSMDEVMDLRNGQWIFMYAVLQSLPLVVIDAPDVNWTDGVEYFLCEVPKGTVPWRQEDSTRKRNWYGIAGGTGVVSLPAELVEHGVEGIYRRSHCWEVAEKWAGDSYVDSYASPEDLPTPTLQLPPSLPGSRSSSPSRLSKRNSIHLGLEALPLPDGVVPSGSNRFSTHNPQKSFEDILGRGYSQSETKKK